MNEPPDNVIDLATEREKRAREARSKEAGIPCSLLGCFMCVCNHPDCTALRGGLFGSTTDDGEELL